MVDRIPEGGKVNTSIILVAFLISFTDLLSNYLQTFKWQFVSLIVTQEFERVTQLHHKGDKGMNKGFLLKC